MNKLADIGTVTPPQDPAHPERSVRPFKDRALEAAGYAAAGVGGMGLGVLAGHGIGMAAERLTPMLTQKPLSPALIREMLPYVGGLAGLSSSLWLAAANGAMKDVSSR